MLDQHRETFIQEANDLLRELEESLLDLEEKSSDQELIGSIFRALHTIKGSGSMFGYDKLATFTHEIETAYDLVRSGGLSVTRILVDSTLSACDEIRGMLTDDEDRSGALSDAQTAIVEGFRNLLKNTHSDKPSAPTPDAVVVDAEVNSDELQHECTYRVRLTPSPDLFSNGTNLLPLFEEMQGLGTCRITAQVENIPRLQELDPEACYTFWDIAINTDRGQNAIRDVFIFVEDRCRLEISVIDSMEREADGKGYLKLGEILVQRGDLSKDNMQDILSQQHRFGELATEAGIIDHGKIESALQEQQLVREARDKRATVEQASTIRVPAERLDSLINMVGELVTVQSRLTQVANSSHSQAILQVAEDVERLTAELRDNTMSIRMVPIGSAFSRLRRLVRDLSQELGKEIDLLTEGAETELDKTVIERLNDPLVHLIRNSVDHGIQTPQVRTAAGKPSRGTIRLSACHSGASVQVTVSDDGQGLDLETIRLKAIEKGLIAPDALLSEREVFALVLLPGFSTAQKVTNVSGRGVGMDVVKKNIDSLQGTIEISSKQNIGTTITLKLPLTLAIIDGLLVRVANEFFVVPLTSIEECVELKLSDVKRASGQHITVIRGELVPYVRLRELFGIDEALQAAEQIVITRVEGNRVGIMVDEVVGQHQTVIKPLGRYYKHINEVTGCSILGDGTIALILDLAKVVKSAARAEAANYENVQAGSV